MASLGTVRGAPLPRGAVPSVVPRRLAAYQKRAVIARSGSEDGGERDVDSLFQKELRRRGLSSIDDLAEPSASSSGQAEASSSGTAGSSSRAPPPPPRFAGARFQADDKLPTDEQLQRSRQLNSEGLEGLIPRGTELLKLGISFFLGFGPFILAVVLASWALYAVFGSSFIHGGSPESRLPEYVDPEVLLAEPTADPMIPTTDLML